MILTDEPISSQNEDILNRNDFVKNLGDSLISWNEKTSLVIGLYGKWGSGKSSVINLTESYLKSLSSNSKAKKSAIIVRFNPWGYSESADLLEPFINEIRSSLKGKNKIKSLSRKLDKYLKIINLLPSKISIKTFISACITTFTILGFSISNFVPQLINYKSIITILSSVFVIIGFILAILGIIPEISKINEEYSKKTASDIKKEISKILEKENRKIIIIIDDIDRLTSTEIKQLFRIVRTNADFQNTVYLLSFDREIIEKSLDVQNMIDGKDYLEKIINIEYDLPNVSKFTLANYLISQLENVIQQLPVETSNIFKKEDTKWSYVYQAILSGFTTIRDVKRYINAISFKLNQFINKDVAEINIIDFIGIEFIRLKYPEYYNFIHQNKLWFITSKQDLDYQIPNKKEMYDKWFEESISNYGYSQLDKDCLDTILSNLFPAIRYTTKDVSRILAPQSANQNDANCSIASERFFDIYFEHVPGIPKNEATNYDVQYIKSISNNYNSLKSAFLDYVKKEKIQSLIKLLESHSLTGSFIPKENFITYFSALFDVIDYIPDNHQLFDFGNDSTIYRIFYFLVKDLNKTENTVLVRELIKKCENPFMPTDILKMEKDSIEKKKSSMSIFIDAEEINNLIILCIEKIKALGESIFAQKYMLRLFWFWNLYEKDSFRIFVNKVITDEVLFLILIDKLSYDQYSYSSRVTVSRKFNYKGLELFGNLDELKTKIEKIKQSNSEEYFIHKDNIELFLNNFDMRNNEFY